MNHRGRLRVGMVLSLLVGLVVSVPGGAANASITDGVALELVASGLSTPVDLAAPPGDDRLFVVEKSGRIKIVEDGVVRATPFLDITGPVNSGASERGLLGLAFDPDYATNGRFYVNYTADSGSGDSRLARYKVSNNPNVADPNSGRVLLQINQPYTNHNGGQVAVGPDGYLYGSFGDGGSGGDPQGNGQNRRNLLGTIVRIDPVTGNAAPDNPFVGATDADDRIWAYGLRNPWRFDFDDKTGDMFIGDVGQNAWEEIDRIPAGVGGLNFGWRIREGTRCYNATTCQSAGLTPPILEYPHSGGGCSGSITGGKVYRGKELPQLRGHYFYIDYCRGGLRSFAWDGAVVERTTWDFLNPPGFVRSFGTDGHGEMYLVAGSSVYKFVSTADPVCDFDGDGDAEVPVGVPDENHSGVTNAGMVYVFQGTPDQFVPGDDKRFWQGNGGVGNTAEKGDQFGEALACGDFNGDGYWDLAVGAPGERRNGRRSVGLVNVLYGSASGLSGSNDQTWHQDSDGIASASQKFDRFGASLAAGDFDGDTYMDLAIGVPGERINGATGAGAVNVLFGSASGLTSSGSQFLHQDAGGVLETAAEDDQFGHALVAADFDGDGTDDLAVGVPNESIDGVDGAGLVQAFPGSEAGLTKADTLWHRGRGAIEGDLAAGATFGSSLAAGYLDGDGFADLAIGVAGDGDPTGSVTVLYGDAGGLSGRDQLWRQGGGGLPGDEEAGDAFGRGLAVGDFDAAGSEDLAVGAPGESRSGFTESGDVTVLFSAPGGLSSVGAQVRHQGQQILDLDPIAFNEFGRILAALDVDGDGDGDLVVAGTGGTSWQGELHLIPGSSGGLTGANDVRWDQDTAGVLGVAQNRDRFGGGLP